jgi:hypothetical protein
MEASMTASGTADIKVTLLGSFFGWITLFTKGHSQRDHHATLKLMRHANIRVNIGNFIKELLEFLQWLNGMGIRYVFEAK